MSFETLLRRSAATAAALLVACLLGFYANRIFMPLPIYAVDESAYLIRALYPPELLANNPMLPELANGVYLALIRLVQALSDNYLPWMRVAGLAAYLGALVVMHRITAAKLSRRDSLAFLLLALAFPYYRFVVTALPEGIYVLVLALIGVATARLYTTRPVLHALAVGALTAVLVLVKPHGMAVVAGLVAMAGIEALASGRWRMAPVRLAVAAATFLLVGNGLQALVGQPIASPVSFFLGGFYGRTLNFEPPPGAGWLAALSAIAMGGAVLMLAGPPILAGLSDILGRWRAARGAKRMRLDGQDLLFLLLLLSLAATIAMVAIYTMKVAGSDGEAMRLWGRYFEFFAPLLWLAGAPFLARQEAAAGARARLAWAVAALVGLGGLLFSLKAGIVLFPWDSSALTAFFHPDPVRAPLGARTPYRLLAAAATVLAAGLLLTRVRPSRAWAAYFLSLAALSTLLDNLWIGEFVQRRTAFDGEIRVAAALIGGDGARSAAAVADPADGHLSFLRLGPQVRILPVGSGACDAATVGAFDKLVVVAPAGPPLGPWRRLFEGRQVSVFERTGPG